MASSSGTFRDTGQKKRTRIWAGYQQTPNIGRNVAGNSALKDRSRTFQKIRIWCLKADAVSCWEDTKQRNLSSRGSLHLYCCLLYRRALRCLRSVIPMRAFLSVTGRAPWVLKVSELFGLFCCRMPETLGKPWNVLLLHRQRSRPANYEFRTPAILSEVLPDVCQSLQTNSWILLRSFQILSISSFIYDLIRHCIGQMLPAS
jgi:hypothetical protein